MKLVTVLSAICWFGGVKCASGENTPELKRPREVTSSMRATPFNGMGSPGWVALDITSPDTTKMYIHERTEDGMVTKVYSPKRGTIHITEVRDGSAILWKADAHSCKHVVTRMAVMDGQDALQGSPILTIILENGEARCFEKTSGEWVEIIADANVRMSALEGITIDLLALPLKGVEITRPSKHYPFLMVRPASNVAITRIIDGSTTLWTAKKGGLCPLASFFVRRGRPILAEIYTQTYEEDDKIYYLEKRVFGWYHITREFYDFLVEKLTIDSFLPNSISAIPLLLAALYSL